MTRRSDLLPIIASLRWTWEQVVACLWLRHLSRQLINSSQFYVPIFALFLLFDADKLSLSEPQCPKIHLIAIWISFRAKRWELTSFFGCQTANKLESGFSVFLNACIINCAEKWIFSENLILEAGAPGCRWIRPSKEKEKKWCNFSCSLWSPKDSGNAESSLRTFGAAGLFIWGGK